MIHIRERVLQLNLDGTGGAYTLAYAVQSKIKNEYIYDYLCMGEFQNSFQKKQIVEFGGRVYELGLRKNRLLGHILLSSKIYEFLCANNYKIVQINADTAWKMLLFAYPAKKAGVKKIIGYSHASDANGDYYSLKRVLHQICKRYLGKYITEYVACTNEAAQWMFPKKCLNYANVIRNGVDIKKYSYSEYERSHLREKYSISKKCVLGLVTDFSKVKNIGFALSLFRALYDVDRDYHLLIAGTGANMAETQSYVSMSGMDEGVTFIGYSNEMHKLYSAMDYLLLPSIKEGYPMCAIEAQVNGIKVLLSDTLNASLKISDLTEFLTIGSIEPWINEIKKSKDPREMREGIKVSYDAVDINNTASSLKILYGMQNENNTK